MEETSDAAEMTVKTGGLIGELPVCTKEGYVFAGWQTRDTITEEDLVGGISKYQFYFGESKSMAGMWNGEYESIYIPAAQIENITEDGETQLYARWVKVKEISNAKEFNEIRNDFSGAYKLTDDIKLEGEWQPIGSYYENYELLNNDWWIHAFRGTLDGNGKTISGLNITESENVHEEGLGLLVDEGTDNDGTKALFGSLTDNAVIKDLIMENSSISIENGEGACYAAPVVGFMIGGEVENVQVRKATVDVISADTKESSMYTSVSGQEERRCFRYGSQWRGIASLRIHQKLYDKRNG